MAPFPFMAEVLTLFSN